MKTQRGSRGIALLFFNPGLFTLLERPGTHCIGGWVGPRAGLDGCGKSRPPPGFDRRIVQPEASRYTD